MNILKRVKRDFNKILLRATSLVVIGVFLFTSLALLRSSSFGGQVWGQTKGQTIPAAVGIRICPLSPSQKTVLSSWLLVFNKKEAVLRPQAVKDRRDEVKFREYLHSEGLDKYPELDELYTDEIKDVLLDDPALRPVFMLVLSGKMVGELHIHNPGLVEKIGGKEILEAHSVFSVGGPATAVRLKKEGYKIIVGVTDKYDNNNTFNFFVANGRQVYFPLNGMWLGVLGAGKLDNETNSNFRLDSELSGFTNPDDVPTLIEYGPLISKGNGLFIQFLGEREIFTIPATGGEFVDATALRYEDGSRFENGTLVSPRIVFNLAVHPHRLNKFPQIIRGDPGLIRITGRIIRSAVSLGILRDGEISSPAQLMLCVAERMGKQEAFKQNNSLFKYSIHSQDFAFLQEADCQEFESRKTHKKTLGSLVEFIRVLDELGIELTGLTAKLKTLDKMMFSAQKMTMPDSTSQYEFIFPDPMLLIEKLFRGYFNTLDDNTLRIWARGGTNKFSALELARCTVTLPNRAGYFYPAESSVPFKEIGKKVIQWANDALRARQVGQVGDGSGGESTPVPIENEKFETSILRSLAVGERAARNRGKDAHPPQIAIHWLDDERGIIKALEIRNSDMERRREELQDTIERLLRKIGPNNINPVRLSEALNANNDELFSERVMRLAIAIYNDQNIRRNSQYGMCTEASYDFGMVFTRLFPGHIVELIDGLVEEGNRRQSHLWIMIDDNIIVDFTYGQFYPAYESRVLVISKGELEQFRFMEWSRVARFTSIQPAPRTAPGAAVDAKTATACSICL